MSDKTENRLDPEAEAFIEETISRIVDDGMMTVGEIGGMSESELEAIYSVGYNLARVGKFADAEKVFRGLVMLDHLSAKYWYALGSVLQQQRKFDVALQVFQLSAFLDSDDPKPQLRCAECHLALGDRENALNALDAMEFMAAKDTDVRRSYHAKGAELRAAIIAGRGK